MNSFEQRLLALKGKVNDLRENILTEEATKSAFVMPFLQVLGYDVFNPLEVIPEFVADISGKKGEKVDYAILQQGEPIIIIECKHWRENLDLHNTQLERYFTFTKAKFGILTNGIQYRFYTDLDQTNKMDPVPFFEINLSKPKDSALLELKKFHKQGFDANEIFDAASELRYIKEIRRIFEGELKEPTVDFVKHFASQVYTGRMTERAVGQFQGLVKRAIGQMINETISDRLHKALVKEDEQRLVEEEEVDRSKRVIFQDDDKGIVTTQEELDGFEIVKEILKETVEGDRIHYRDTKSYFGILLDDNNRKPICRLKLDSARKYLIWFDEERNEVKKPIEKVEHIYMYANALNQSARKYLD